MFNERANLYENLWSELKAYAKRYAASGATVPVEGEAEVVFLEFLSQTHAPPLPADARGFYTNELRQLIRDFREGVAPR